MFPVETLPQSIVDTKTIVLKPRLDQGDIQLIGEKLKPKLFSKFGIKPRPEHVKLLASELYLEPYLIIGGRYYLDYCKKHVFRVNVEETTTKVYVAGQEFKSVQSGPKATDRTIRMTGQENAHHERQAYFILDRLKREVPPDRLPISPFDFLKTGEGRSSSFKSVSISDEEQIEFLRSKVAARPDDVAEIIREIFDITDRTIAYYPMYQLTFESKKSQTEAVVTINGITGEIILNGIQKLAAKTIVSFPESRGTQPIRISTQQSTPAQHTLQIGASETKKIDHSPEERRIVQSTATMENAPPRFQPEMPKVPLSGDGRVTFVEFIEIPSGSVINKDIVTKDTLKIGDNCRTHGRMEALKDIIVGADTVIEGDLVSGGNVAVGSRSFVSGSLQAAGKVEIGKDATIQGGILSYPAAKVVPQIQLEVVEVEELQEQSILQTDS